MVRSTRIAMRYPCIATDRLARCLCINLDAWRSNYLVRQRASNHMLRRACLGGPVARVGRVLALFHLRLVRLPTFPTNAAAGSLRRAEPPGELFATESLHVIAKGGRSQAVALPSIPARDSHWSVRCMGTPPPRSRSSYQVTLLLCSAIHPDPIV